MYKIIRQISKAGKIAEIRLNPRSPHQIDFTFKGKAPSPAEFLRTHSLELHRQGVNTYWANEYHPRRETALFKADIGKHTTAVYSPKQEKSTWTVRLNSTSLEQMTQAQRTKLKAMLQKLKIA